ncbi:MAG: phosphoribosylglycinamide formyltransferase [Thermomicrobiales bacterium]
MTESAHNTNHFDPHPTDRLPRLAVLLSGAGRTLDNLLQWIRRGDLSAEIVVVASSKSLARGLHVAQSAGVPAIVVERKDASSDEEFSGSVFDALAPFEPDLIILAGFLRKLVVPPEWEGRILNIHPALLPEMSAASGKGFYGERVHAEVLRRGSKLSGATVHLVDNDYDSGQVLARAVVPVEPEDTVESLAARVFAAECQLYPTTIRDYLETIKFQDACGP